MLYQVRILELITMQIISKINIFTEKNIEQCFSSLIILYKWLFLDCLFREYERIDS